MARAFDDASNQYLNTNAAVVSAEPMTFACWFQTDDTGLGTSQRLMVICDSSVDVGRPNRALHIQANAVGLKASADDGATIGEAQTSVTINASTWYHAAAVFTSVSSRAVFFEGGNKGTNSTTVNALTGADDTVLGARTRGFPVIDELSGQLAEAGLWSAALTDAEIAIHALGYSALFIRPASLVAYWPLIGRMSPEIARVGGYDMTLVNGPTWATHPRVIMPSQQIIGPPAPSVDVAANINISPSRSYIQIV